VKSKKFLDLEHNTIAGTSSKFTEVVTSKPTNTCVQYMGESGIVDEHRY